MPGTHNASDSEMPQSNHHAELRKSALMVLARIIAKDILRKALTEKDSSNPMRNQSLSQPLDDNDPDRNEGNG